MVERQVKEQRLARDGLESRGEVHEVGLLGDEGRVQAEGLKPFNQGLEVKSQGVDQTDSGTFCVCGTQSGPARAIPLDPHKSLIMGTPLYS